MGRANGLLAGETGSDGPGIDGGILRYQDKMPRTINSVEVKSVDEYMEKATRSGGKVAKPKMSIPGVGYQAYFLDTEGNVVGYFSRIHQRSRLLRDFGLSLFTNSSESRRAFTARV